MVSGIKGESEGCGPYARILLFLFFSGEEKAELTCCSELGGQSLLSQRVSSQIPSLQSSKTV